MFVFITDHIAYASSNSNQNRLNRDGTLFFFYPGWMRLMFTCVLGQSSQYPNLFRRALTASVDSCAEIKSAPSVS